MNEQVHGSGEGVEGGGADDGVCVGLPDCQMRLGAEETSAFEFDYVEDGGFVGSEDLDFPVSRARMVDVEQARGRGRSSCRGKSCHGVRVFRVRQEDRDDIDCLHCGN